MKKRDVAEIKKQLSPSNCGITRMCTCYVNNEGQKEGSWSQTFLSMEEDESFKFFDLFKKSLSGGLNKTMHNIEFPMAEEEEGGAQEFLMRLKNSRLQDEALISEFFDRIIESYQTTEHYYIALTHTAYDIPSKAKDGDVLEDGEDVHEYLSCVISPLELRSQELYFNPATAKVELSSATRVVGKPTVGFLFPAFDDRATNIHELLFYTKSGKDMQEDFLDGMFGCSAPVTAPAQKELYQQWVEDSIGEGGNIEIVTALNDKMIELLEENEQHKLTGDVLQVMLREVESERLSTFKEVFEKTIGDKELSLSNLVDKSLTVSVGEIAVKASDLEKHNVSIQRIDKRKCIVIPVSGAVDVNGIVMNGIESAGK